VFVLFAAGHTLGFLAFTPPTAEGRAVRDAMNTVHFTASGSTFSYGDFYRGFGLSISASMLFEAFLAWQLGTLVRIAPGVASSIGWALSGLQLATFVLSCLYFSIAPAIFSLALAAMLGWAAWRSEEAQGRRAVVAAA
jgi:hypothetical protein